MVVHGGRASSLRYETFIVLKLKNKGDENENQSVLGNYFLLSYLIFAGRA